MHEANEPPSPSDRLVAAMYDELRRIAGRLMRDGGGSRTLQPTAVVHEAYLKLAVADSAEWKSDTHFFAVAALAVRQVLIDHVRRARRQKRGGGARQLSLDSSIIGGDSPGADAIELDDALSRLEREDARAAKVVELRFFGGMTIDQVADHLNLSTPTIERDWRFARAWLYHALVGERPACRRRRENR